MWRSSTRPYDIDRAGTDHAESLLDGADGADGANEVKLLLVSEAL